MRAAELVGRDARGRLVARFLPNAAGDAFSDAIAVAAEDDPGKGSSADVAQGKKLGDLEAKGVDKGTGTSLGTEAEDVVLRQSDNESRCARFLEGSSAKPGDREACFGYLEALRADPAGTIAQTVGTYLVGEQYIAGQLCNSVLATNPYSWAGCQVVGHLLGKRIGAWLHDLFTGEPDDCRGGRDANAFARELFAHLSAFAVDVESADQILTLSNAEGTTIDSYLARCGQVWSTPSVQGPAFFEARFEQLVQAAAKIHDDRLEVLVDEAKAAGLTLPELRDELLTKLSEARAFSVKMLWVKDNWNQHYLFSQHPEAIDPTWEASAEKRNIDAANVILRKAAEENARRPGGSAGEESSTGTAIAALGIAVAAVAAYVNRKAIGAAWKRATR